MSSALRNSYFPRAVNLDNQVREYVGENSNKERGDYIRKKNTQGIFGKNKISYLIKMKIFEKR